MIKHSIIILTLVLGVFSGLKAQKLGYVDSAELLTNMEEVKKADSEITAFQNQLMEKGQKMMAQFEANYKNYMAQANAGTLSKVKMAEHETQLQEEQQKIGLYEQEMKQKILEKREALLKPILAKVDGIIKTIGKENGYDFIFDSSLGTLLYKDQADDLTAQVKARL